MFIVTKNIKRHLRYIKLEIITLNLKICLDMSICILRGDVTTVVGKIKDIIDEIKDTIEWILNGCPKPVKIPVKGGKGGKGRKR